MKDLTLGDCLVQAVPGALVVTVAGQYRLTLTTDNLEKLLCLTYDQPEPDWSLTLDENGKLHGHVNGTGQEGGAQ
jgi:hypothetical protein